MTNEETERDQKMRPGAAMEKEGEGWAEKRERKVTKPRKIV